MIVVLYNPLSKSGNKEKINKIIRKKLKLKADEFVLENLININDVKEFIVKYQDAKSFIIFGGDGTLNNLANNIVGLDIKQNIYLYKSGTGNDFRRSLKERGNLINIKKYLTNLPTVYFDNEESKFLNVVGLGIDGMVCNKVNNCKRKKNKWNYFRHAYNSFKESTRSDVKINGTLYKDAWLVSIMNDKYYGGGMKVAPKANRNKKSLEVVVIQKAPKWIVALVFPTIYLGIHKIFKRYVKFLTLEDVLVQFSEPKFMQIDGEDYKMMKEIKVESYR